jgi:SAM-dependent methyltransferase
LIEPLYDDLADLWPLLRPPEVWAEEAHAFGGWLRQAAGEVRAVLELGCGCGELAAALDPAWDLCLVDRAPAMLALARARVPRAEHVLADLRTLALPRTFDAVLLHDAVMYLLTEEDLLAAFRVARAHLRPGGALLVVPDVVAEDFEEHTAAGGGGERGRAVRLLEWHHDPDPTDSWYQVDFAVLARGSDGEVRAHHDRHRLGLHARRTYARLLRQAGFALLEPAIPAVDVELSAVFLGRATRGP